MRATIEDNLWIWFDNITESEEEILWQEFSVSKPNEYIDTSQMSMWDGVYRKYNRAKRRMARPLLSMLKGVCLKHNLPLQIEDNRPKWKYSPTDPKLVDKDFLPGITLDDHQVRAIRKACVTECGIINIPTGGGKGEIIAGFCKAIDCPTIILADQTVVIDQLKSRLEMRDVDDDIGLFYSGKRPSGQTIVVGSIQSLHTPSQPPKIPDRVPDESEEDFNKRMAKWELQFKAYKSRKKNAAYLQKYVKNAEMIIVDECDKAAGEQWKKLFRHWFKGRRRYGFSGTPTDPEKPVEAMVMQEHLGSIIEQETRKKLVKIGRIISCDYTMIGVGPFDQIKESSAYDIARNDYMVENIDFHKTIAAICKKHKGDGTLVLVDQIPLGHSLVEILNKYGLTSHFIYGETRKKRRDEILRAFEKREFDVLVGGKIINRGLDLSGGCENLIIASGGKLQSEFEQKIGRALRINKRGKSRIYDFFFRCNKYLYNHSKSRLKIMIGLGYPTKLIFPNGKIEGEKFVKSNFVLPPKYYK